MDVDFSSRVMSVDFHEFQLLKGSSLSTIGLIEGQRHHATSTIVKEGGQ